jgi:putative glutamine amidotransferase
MPRARKSRRPLILVTPSSQAAGAEFDDPSISLSLRYSNAVFQAGGMPWVLPASSSAEIVAEAIDRCDGVLLSGGDDISHQIHRPDASPDLRSKCGAADVPRDVFELLVLQTLFAEPRPLLAICRGHQLMNVALGGTLILDLVTEVSTDVPHNACDRKDQLVHPVALDPKSLLARISGKKSLRVNSTHHQAIDQLAPELRAVAVAPDGLVEATEFAEGAEGFLPWFISVQYHPERLAPRHAVHRKLIEAFIKASAKPR